MKNNYIKLNNNYNHLSLGNLFNIIKQNSKNKSSAIQTELFCLLFNVDSISDTTVGNYCTGYRAIGSDFKQIYLNYQKKYEKDKTILLPNINNILTVMDGHIHNYQGINEINTSESLKLLVTNLHSLAKNDIYAPNKLKNDILTFINNDNYYEALCIIIFFIVLEKKQPLYESDLVIETIEEILKNTNMSVNDLKNYLNIVFKEGLSLNYSLKKLATLGNPYALHELGNKEYNGEITGYPRYEAAYKYYLQAAEYNHPTSNWMIAHMILNKKIGSLSSDDLDTAWKYLEKALSLDSISTLNTIGLCYLSGLTKDKTPNKTLAKEYFEKAANKNYLYAHNNLGRIYEGDKDYKNALKEYLISANEEESWACNKVGLYYYNGLGTKKDIKKAYYYFNLGLSSPIKNRNPWNVYNLVKLFLLKGNTELGIKKDTNKSILLLDTLDSFEAANELYLYAYYDKYLNDKTKENLDKVKYYLSIINNSKDKKHKLLIEKEIKKIDEYYINLNL